MAAYDCPMRFDVTARVWLAAGLLSLAPPAGAAPMPAAPLSSPIHAGPVIPGFGAIADVAIDQPIPLGTVFSHVFAINAGAPGALNTGLDDVARFINLHTAAGVPRSDIQPAVVLRGRAIVDALDARSYARHYSGQANPNAALVAALVAAGAEIYVCGQDAARLGVTRADLQPGVRMALSAETAHALLQQRGFTLNPT